MWSVTSIAGPHRGASVVTGGTPLAEVDRVLTGQNDEGTSVPPGQG